MTKRKETFEIEEYLQFIAIATSLKDYRVAFFVNELLHLDLKLIAPIVVDKKAKGEISTYSRFFYEDELSGLSFHLVENKSSNGFLVKSLKNIDFILIIKRYEEDTIDISSLANKLKKNDSIQVAIAVESIKTSEYNTVMQYLPFEQEEDENITDE